MTTAELLLFRAWANHTFPAFELDPQARIIQAAAFLEGFASAAKLTGLDRKEASNFCRHQLGASIIMPIITRMCNIAGLKQLDEDPETEKNL